jgi:hypothetical protein
MDRVKFLGFWAALLVISTVFHAGCWPIDELSSSGENLLQESFVALGEVPRSQRIIAAEGGRICDVQGFVHLDVPPGSLAADTDISMALANGAPELGALTALEPGVDFGPDGTQFSPSATVTFHYAGVLPAGASPNELSIVAVSANGQVEQLTDVRVDTAAQTVSGSTAHFTSFYMVLGGAPSPGPSLRVGGPGLVPLYGSASPGQTTHVAVWVGAGGKIRNNPYSPDFVEDLVIQVQETPGAGGEVKQWVTDPVNPGASTLNEVNEPILTQGFWYDTFFASTTSPLSGLQADAQGVKVHVISGALLLKLLNQAPAGYSSGRIHIRAEVPGAAPMDLHLSFGRSPFGT